MSQAEPEMEKSNLALVLPRVATIYSFFPLKEGEKKKTNQNPAHYYAGVSFSPCPEGSRAPSPLAPSRPHQPPHLCAPYVDHPLNDVSLPSPFHPSPRSWDTPCAQKPQVYKRLSPSKTSLHQLNQPLFETFPKRDLQLSEERRRAARAPAHRPNLAQANTCGQRRTGCTLAQALMQSNPAREQRLIPGTAAARQRPAAQKRAPKEPPAPCSVSEEKSLPPPPRHHGWAPLADFSCLGCQEPH